jgi:tetratricopeptide (TPR) repeat protein
MGTTGTTPIQVRGKARRAGGWLGVRPALSARFLLLPTLCSGLFACAAAPPRDEPPVLIHHGPPVAAAVVDVLEVTPEMAAFLDRYVLPYGDPDMRVELLARSVANAAMLGFRYDERLTLSAAEAFQRRRGNCVSYANLVVALARASGLHAYYQQVEVRPSWSGTDDTVLVPRHVVAIVQGERRAYLLDSSGAEISPDGERQRLSDVEALSLYHSNLGAEALLERDLSAAYGQFLRAIEMAPGRADPWVNLGVVYGRNWQLDAAEFAYRAALERDRNNISALSNLYEVFKAQNDQAAAEEVAQAVERHRRRNPYHLYHLAETALEEGRPDQAQALLQKAIALKPEEDRFHAALARTQAALNR